MSFSPLIIVNGVHNAQISPLDRGFAYGDGVFETMAMESGDIRLLNWHLARLNDACQTLSIPLNESTLLAQLEQTIAAAVAAKIDRAIVKIIVTRGEGGRGYATPNPVRPTLCTIVNPPANHPLGNRQNGIKLFACSQTLGRNRSLAGLKHLNKLEYILARDEWSDDTYAEGLICDDRGHIIEGTFSNIFFVCEGALVTPRLSQCGVAGVMRKIIIEELAPLLSVPVRQIDFLPEDLDQVDEVFVCNSVIGIWPVMSYAKHSWTVGDLSRKLQTALQTFLGRAE